MNLVLSLYSHDCARLLKGHKYWKRETGLCLPSSLLACLFGFKLSFQSCFPTNLLFLKTSRDTQSKREILKRLLFRCFQTKMSLTAEIGCWWRANSGQPFSLPLYHFEQKTGFLPSFFFSFLFLFFLSFFLFLLSFPPSPPLPLFLPLFLSFPCLVF